MGFVLKICQVAPDDPESGDAGVLCFTWRPEEGWVEATSLNVPR